MPTSKKNILQVFASKTWGGGEQYVYDLSVSLIQDNYSVVCLSRKSSAIKNKLKEKQIKLYQMPINGVFDLYSTIKIREIIKKHSIDIIHTHNFKTAFVVVIANILSKKKAKVIVSRHIIKKAKTSSLYRWLYSKIDKIIFVSDLALNVFCSSEPKIDKSKCVVIYNSIKINDNYDQETISLKEKFNIPKSNILLLYCGRLIENKGIEVLLKAMSILKDKDIFLLVAGLGEKTYEDRLKTIVNTYKINEKVKFIGFINDLSPIIAQIDIGICPSIIKESFGLSIVQFMGQGKPVITTNNGAQKDYITNMKNGILVQPNSYQELFESIFMLSSNPILRKTIGINAKTFFNKNFSYKAFYNNIITQYDI